MTQTPGENVGSRIAKYRKLNGWTAQELADKAGEGLTRSVLANIENGRRDDIGVKQLVAISAALQVPPAALLLDLDRPFEETTLRLGPLVVVQGESGQEELQRQPMALVVAEAAEWLAGIEGRGWSPDWPPARQHVWNLLQKIADARRANDDLSAMFLRFIHHEQANGPDDKALADSFLERAREAELRLAAIYRELQALGAEVPDRGRRESVVERTAQGLRDGSYNIRIDPDSLPDPDTA